MKLTPPGYPTQEALSALVWRGGPFALNGLRAPDTDYSDLHRVAFHFNLSPYLPSLMFIFSPLVYVSSVTTIDYQFATGFSCSACIWYSKTLRACRHRAWLSAGAHHLAGFATLAIYIYLTEGGATRWRALLTFTIARSPVWPATFRR